MMKRAFLIVAGMICILSTVVSAASEPEIIWAGGGLRLADECAPIYSAETFVSIGQMDTTYILSNPMIFIKEGDLGIDLGIGARVPILGGQAVAGYNLYFDYTTDNKHKRISTGAEFFHPYFSSHINMYVPISDDRRGEQALPGLDLSFGIPMPNASFITVWPGAYFYNGLTRSNMKGLSLTVEARPIKILSFYLGGRNDVLEGGRNDRGEIFGGVTFTIPMGRLDQDLFKFNKGEYPLNVGSMLDHRVVREPFITYEHIR